MSPLALHHLLAFDHQSRQRSTTTPPTIWDLKQSPSHARPAARPNHHIPTHQLTQHATSPPTPIFRITSGVFPFPWHIDIRNPYGVTVGDVLEGLYAGLRRGVTQYEWAHTSRTQRARVAEAFYGRVQQSKDKKWEHAQGVRRVDWLLRHTRFVGLSPSADAPYTWHLTTKRYDA